MAPALALSSSRFPVRLLVALVSFFPSSFARTQKTARRYSNLFYSQLRRCARQPNRYSRKLSSKHRISSARFVCMREILPRVSLVWHNFHFGSRWATMKSCDDWICTQKSNNFFVFAISCSWSVGKANNLSKWLDVQSTLMDSPSIKSNLKKNCPGINLRACGHVEHWSRDRRLRHSNELFIRASAISVINETHSDGVYGEQEIHFVSLSVRNKRPSGQRTKCDLIHVFGLAFIAA